MDVCRTAAGVVYSDGTQEGDREVNGEEGVGLGIKGVEGLFDGFVGENGDVKESDDENSRVGEGEWRVCGCKGCEKWSAKRRKIVC